MDWLWGSLIGVVSTLLGTFLGWLLSKPKNGKVSIILNEPICPYINRYLNGVINSKKGKLYSIDLRMNLIFYNSSDNVKLVRNIRALFFDANGKLLFKYPLKNLDDTTTLIGSIHIPKGIDSINIAPRFGELFRCEVTLYDELLESKNLVSKICIAYDDEKSKVMKQEMQLIDLKSIEMDIADDEKE